MSYLAKCILILLLSPFCYAQTPTPPQQSLEQIKTYLKEAESKGFSGAVLIAQNGKCYSIKAMEWPTEQNKYPIRLKRCSQRVR